MLEVREVPQPEAIADQVLVRVRASALNRADLLQRQGRYPAPPGFPQEIPGMEFAGEVAEVGPLVKMWKPGQRVFGLVGGGAQAEYVSIQERLLAEIPTNLGWREAAAIPEVFITAHDGLWKQAELRPGETVLIPSVGSGVGLAAVQSKACLSALHARPTKLNRPKSTDSKPALRSQITSMNWCRQPRDGPAARESTWSWTWWAAPT